MLTRSEKVWVCRARGRDQCQPRLHLGRVDDEVLLPPECCDRPMRTTTRIVTRLVAYEDVGCPLCGHCYDRSVGSSAACPVCLPSFEALADSMAKQVAVGVTQAAEAFAGLASGFVKAGKAAVEAEAELRKLMVPILPKRRARPVLPACPKRYNADVTIQQQVVAKPRSLLQDQRRQPRVNARRGRK